MENQPKPKKEFLENYRDNLANDLREMRNQGDKEGAEKVLEEERETTRYKKAEDVHKEEKEETQDEKYLTPEQKETFTKEMDKFWKEMFKSRGVDASKTTFTPRWRKQGEIDWEYLTNQIVKEEFGEYVANPETALLDYESMGEPEIFDFDPATNVEYKKWLRGGSIYRFRNNMVNVIDYINETYADTYYFPGIEYQKYLYEEFKKDPQNFKNKFPSLTDGKAYYFPGSVYCEFGGDWRMPFGYWGSGKWEWYGGSNGYWGSSNRVLLFKK